MSIFKYRVKHSFDQKGSKLLLISKEAVLGIIEATYPKIKLNTALGRTKAACFAYLKNAVLGMMEVVCL